MRAYPKVERFESVSIVLPVINETSSLRQTVETILRDVPRNLIKELLIVVCKRTTAESAATIAKLRTELGELVVVLEQRLPFLGGAYRDAIEAARGSHLLIMGSDLETDPGEVRLLLAAAQRSPAGIIATSRWKRGGAFHGYPKPKLICNWVFQRFFSALYWTRLTDLTYGFRVMPTKLMQAIRWEELRHPFNLECLLKPLRLGVPAIELPSVWHHRMEGESQNTFWRNFEYFRVGLKVRFARKNEMLKPAGGGMEAPR